MVDKTARQPGRGQGMGSHLLARAVTAVCVVEPDQDEPFPRDDVVPRVLDVTCDCARHRTEAMHRAVRGAPKKEGGVPCARRHDVAGGF